MDHSAIYLDFAATTPVDEAVVATMLPYFGEHFGNPSSRHAFGRQAAKAVRDARRAVAWLVGGSAGQLVFTGSATEAANLLVSGLSAADPSLRWVVSSIEHKAVLEPLRQVRSRGQRVDELPPNPEGIISSDGLAAMEPRPGTIVAVMWVNNETGVVQPVAEIAAVCRATGSRLIVDATQAVGKVDTSAALELADAVFFSAHKMYGPKGIGALAARPETLDALQPMLLGGGQERGIRAGTENVPAIVGFGEAARIVVRRRTEDWTRTQGIRGHFIEALGEEVTGWRVHGDQARVVPHIVNIGFDDVDGEALLANLHSVAVSTGSACSSALPQPSHVLRAMGLSEEEAFNSIRVSLGRGTTEQDVRIAAARIGEAVRRIRSLLAS